MAYYYYLIHDSNNNFQIYSFLKIFIMTHKDFNNYRYNSAYTIVANDQSQLKGKYNLSIIFANKGKLYKLRRAYCEMSLLVNILA